MTKKSGGAAGSVPPGGHDQRVGRRTPDLASEHGQYGSPDLVGSVFGTHRVLGTHRFRSVDHGAELGLRIKIEHTPLDSLLCGTKVGKSEYPIFITSARL